MKVRVTKKNAAVEEVPIHTEFIKLQDFLKFANAVESGGMAKNMILAEEVKVNGEKRSAENYACVIEKVAADVTVEVRFEKASGCSGSIDAGLGIALLLLVGAMMIKKSVNKQEEIR